VSLFADSLAAQIRTARAALRGNDNGHHPLLLAANRAADCLADLERAERLLDSERSSAEAAERALDRAAQLFEVEQQQQRLADEAAAEAEADAAADPERERLLKTIALAEEAIREAATLRRTPQPGETMEATRQRWDDAHQIETAAIACRKAARKALAARTVFADKRSPEQQAEAIEATRTAALALKAAIDAHRERAQRGRVGRKKGGAK